MRITPKNANELPLLLKPFGAAQRRKYQKVLPPTLAWAWIPEAYLGFSAMYSALTRKSSALAPQLRLLATLRVAQLNHCAFCVDYNAHLFAEAGGS